MSVIGERTFRILAHSFSTVRFSCWSDGKYLLKFLTDGAVFTVSHNLQWQCYKIYFYACTIQTWLIKHFKPSATLCIVDLHLFEKECSQWNKRNFVEGQPIFKSHHPDDMSIYANISLLVFRLLELENELIQISSHWPRVMQEWRPREHSFCWFTQNLVNFPPRCRWSRWRPRPPGQSSGKLWGTWGHTSPAGAPEHPQVRLQQ